jgi:hypothetical protein
MANAVSNSERIRHCSIKVDQDMYRPRSRYTPSAARAGTDGAAP